MIMTVKMNNEFNPLLREASQHRMKIDVNSINQAIQYTNVFLKMTDKDGLKKIGIDKDVSIIVNICNSTGNRRLHRYVYSED